MNYNFPIYKVPEFDSLRNVLGKVKVTKRGKEYLLDDKRLSGDLAARRLQLKAKKEKLFPLKTRIDTLRQLVKRPSGEQYIDSKGIMFKYKKGNKRYPLISEKIRKIIPKNGLYIVHVDKINSPFVVFLKDDRVEFASILYTDSGPFLYDLTRENHAPTRRAI
jgi:hypothetical protein